MDNETLKKFDLKGGIAVITGGGGLLGIQHAEALLDANCKIILLDIDRDNKLEKQITSLKEKYGNNAWGYKIDITGEKNVADLVEKIENEIGPIGILINNAANNPKVESGTKNFSRLENFPEKSWDDDLAVGLTGAYIMSKIIGTRMAKRGKGVILHIASELGVIAPDQRLYRQEGLDEKNQPVKPVTYSVVKHGLIGLSKYLATYWADKGVRSNAVAFGGVENGQPADFIARLSKLIPMGRMAKPDEYKAVVLFLCSDASSFMTGSTVSIDGGRTAW